MIATQVDGLKPPESVSSPNSKLTNIDTVVHAGPWTLTFRRNSAGLELEQPNATLYRPSWMCSGGGSFKQLHLNQTHAPMTHIFPRSGAPFFRENTRELLWWRKKTKSIYTYRDK